MKAWTPAEVLPHRPPMLLLSRIVSWSADSLIGEVDIADGGTFWESGFGVPRWLALEYMAQAAGALHGIRVREAGRQVPVGYLLGTRRLVGIDGYFVGGTQLQIVVQQYSQGENGVSILSCRTAEGRRSASCRLMVYSPPHRE